MHAGNAFIMSNPLLPRPLRATMMKQQAQAYFHFCATTAADAAAIMTSPVVQWDTALAV